MTRKVRLGRLEEQAAAKVEAVEAVKEATIQRALARLSREDLKALQDHQAAQDEGRAWWAEVVAAGEALEAEPLPDPVGEEARRWGWAASEVTEGQPFPAPAQPEAFAVYFEAEADRCATVLGHFEAGAALPEDIRREAAVAAARWGVAGWRLDAALAREVRS